MSAVQVFCNRSIKFRNPDDQNITHTIRNHTFEYAPEWITQTDMFAELERAKEIKLIKSAKDLADVETNGKVVAQQLENDENGNSDSSDEYSDMTNKQLYNLCIEKGIEAEEKQNKAYYLEKLQA